jgi:hypothetical protein
MSIEGFVKHGYNYGLLQTKPAGVYGEVQVYDIGVEGTVGVRYSDNSRQAQPHSWHSGIERLLAAHVREKPTLRKKEQQLPERPRLSRKADDPDVDAENGDRSFHGPRSKIPEGMHESTEGKPKLPPPRKMRPSEIVAAAQRNHEAINPTSLEDLVPKAELAAARPHLKGKRHG